MCPLKSLRLSNHLFGGESIRTIASSACLKKTANLQWVLRYVGRFPNASESSWMNVMKWMGPEIQPNVSPSAVNWRLRTRKIPPPLRSCISCQDAWAGRSTRKSEQLTMLYTPKKKRNHLLKPLDGTLVKHKTDWTCTITSHLKMTWGNPVNHSNWGQGSSRKNRCRCVSEACKVQLWDYVFEINKFQTWHWDIDH